MRWIVQTRGGSEPGDGAGGLRYDTCVESRHPWVGCAVQRGRVVWQSGHDVETTWRSAAKPIQLATSIASLGDPWLREEELAIGAASHSGEPRHVRWVREVLARFDVAESDLKCGAHPPVHAPSADALAREGEQASAIHNNCSGKHAFMLAAAARNGWPLDYRPADHPLQRAILERVVEWSGQEPRLAVDGCGVPTFCLHLSAIARAWSVVAEAMADPLDRTRLGKIGLAMAAHAGLTSGTERLEESVVRHCGVPLAAKIGAQGVFCMALPDRGLGIAVKVLSGVSEALPAAVSATLRAVAADAWTEPPLWRFREVRNVVGRLVGFYSDSAGPDG